MADDELINTDPITELSKAQRRVLGVLLEKSFTTPEYYPMTLKAITTGCNQKNNRQPLTEYSEDDAAEALEELRELALVAVVHTESGRTERFRHYARKRFTFSEPQLAIMTELLLRGRQSLGELRSRASRMVAIDSLEQLRDELDGLQRMNYVQSNGPLDRRGIEVDHNLYQPRENRKLTAAPAEARMHGTDEEESASAIHRPAASTGRSVATVDRPVGSVPAAAARVVTTINPPHSPPGTVPASAEDSRAVAVLERAVADLQQQNREMRDQLESLAAEVRQMTAQISELRTALGG